jgi:hypothetical protein
MLFLRSNYLNKYFMKKNLIIIFLICLFFGATAQAQYNKHEIMAGYGYYSNIMITVKLALHADDWSQNLLQQQYSIPLDSLKRFGDIHLSYKYRVHKRIMVGVALVYSGFKVPVHNNTTLSGIETQKIGDLRYHIFTIAPEMNVLYFANENSKMYGNFGLGYTLGMIHYTNSLNETNYKWSKRFNYQVTPIAFRFGSNIGGFVELGFGYKGIFCGGLFFNL